MGGGEDGERENGGCSWIEMSNGVSSERCSSLCQVKFVHSLEIGKLICI